MSIVLIGLPSAALAGPAAGATGPYQVRDINGGGGSSTPSELTAVGARLFFTAKGGGKGRELWISDGTSPGTYRVKDILPGSAGSSPTELTALGGLVFFAANDGAHGDELWVSDGTNPGTQRLTDINPGIASSGVGYLTAVGDSLYFFARDADFRLELWRSDGTVAGTTFVKQLFAGAVVDAEPAAFGARLFFGLDMCGGNVCSGEGLWVSNGTASGTKQFYAVYEDISYPSEITRVGSRLYWDDVDGLLRSNGTASTTKSMGVVQGSSLTNVGGTLMFHGYVQDESDANDGLWKSNGTVASTALVMAFGNIYFLTRVGGALFFRAWSGSDRTLFVSDGTSAGTDPLLTVDQTLRLDALTDVGGVLYFIAPGTTTDVALWMSDGTPTGTQLVAEGVDDAGQLTNVAGSLYFTDDDGVHGNELWRYIP